MHAAPAPAAVPAVRLAAFYLTYFAAFGAFVPYFPLWLEHRGLGAAAIGSVMSLWYGMRVVAPGVWSHYTLASTRPIAWLRLGAAATLLSFAGFVFELAYVAMLVVMAAYSFFCNAIMPQFEAVTLSHLAGEPHRYGRIRLWGSVGFIAVVAALGLLFDHVSLAWLPWLMLPMLGSVIVAAYGTDYGPAHANEGARESLLTSLRRPGTRSLLAVAFLMQVAHGPTYVFLSIYLADAGYRPALVGALWATGVLAEIGMFWVATRWLARHGAVRMLRLSLGVAVLRFVVTALYPALLPVMLLAQATHAFTFGLFHAACMQRTAWLFPGWLLGQGQSLVYGLGSGLGGVAGSLIAGAAWPIDQGHAAFLAAGVIAAVGLLVALRMAPRERSVSVE
jgi:PPP family 3-phenylpropionic acid transporter